LPLSFPLLLSTCYSCTFPTLCTLVFLCPLQSPSPSQIFLLHSLHLLLLLPFPDLCSIHQHALYHALEHHHSGPELTSLLSPSYSPHASSKLVRFPHYLSHLRLARGSLVEDVAQVLELAHSFYLAFFPLPLALLILPLSLVEHHHFRLLNIHFQLFLRHILFQVPHHFFHLSLTLCHNHHVVRKRQAPNFLPAHQEPPPLALSSTFRLRPLRYREQQRAERAALSHSLCRLKPFALFLSHLHLVSCSRIYLLDLPHQSFTYFSLSFSLSHTFKHFHSVNVVERRPEVYEQCAHPPPFSSSIRSLLNCPGCTHCP
jgi:hypothetical protein